MEIKLSSLRTLSPENRERWLKKFTDGASVPTNGQRDTLALEIESFEAKFGMTSNELLQRLASGETRETWEISQWLHALKVRELLDAAR